MLIIAGTFTVHPDDRDAFLAAATDVMRDTRQEAGCHAYVFTPDMHDDAVVHLFEKWESPEHLAAHFQAPHLAGFRAALKPLRVSASEIKRYDVTNEAAL